MRPSITLNITKYEQTEKNLMTSTSNQKDLPGYQHDCTGKSQIQLDGRS